MYANKRRSRRTEQAALGAVAGLALLSLFAGVAYAGTAVQMTVVKRPPSTSAASGASGAPGAPGAKVQMTVTKRSSPSSTVQQQASSGTSGATSTAATSTSASADLRKNATLQLRAAKITSSYENSTLTLQYGYAEDIGDGNGITAGRAGFCSGTSDLLKLVQNYTKNYPNNGLAKYVSALQQVNGSDSHAGLDGFEAAFKTEAEKPEFRKAQDDLVDELYLNPALELADSVGVKTPLGQAIFWDTNIQHGLGGTEGLKGIAQKTGKVSGDEAAYLLKFLENRRQTLYGMYPDMKDGNESSDSRVDGLESLVKAGKMNLTVPFSWTAYGQTFTVSK